MPVLQHKDGGQAVFTTQEEVQAALASGEWALPQGAKYRATGSEGTTFEGSPEELAYKSDTFAPGAIKLSESTGRVEEEAWNSPLDRTKAFGEGAASSLSFGLSDVALAAAGADTASRERLTAGRGWGEAAGIAATMAAPFMGAAALATPATALSAAAARAGTRGARLALAGVEGAAFGAGNVLSKVALSDPGLTAESLAAAGGDIFQGALLGSALGLGGGLVGEGAGALIARRAAKRAATPSAAADFASGPGKQAARQIGQVHSTIEGIAGEVATATKKAADDLESVLKQNVEHLHGGRSSVLRSSVDEVQQAFKAETARFSNETAQELTALKAAAEAGDTAKAFAKYNELAPFVGLARISTREAREPGVLGSAIGDVLTRQWDDAYKKSDKLFTKAMAKGSTDDDMVKYLKHVNSLASKEDMPGLGELAAKQLNVYETSAKQVDDYANLAREQLAPKSPIKMNKVARDALGLRDGEKLNPNAIRRLAETPDLVERLGKFGAYYDEVGKAAAGHPTLKLQYDDAIKQLNDAVGALLTPEARQALTPQAVASILGGETAAANAKYVQSITELAAPAQSVLQLVALHKGLTGLSGMKVKKGSLLRRLGRSATRAAAYAAGASVGWSSGVGEAAGALLGGMGKPLVAAVGGRVASEGAGRLLGSRASAVKDAADAVNGLKAEMSDMVINGLGKGKPASKTKLRVLPGVHKVLDKLIGDPQVSKGKTEQEKFTIVQDRLAQFAASPQSALDGIYHGIAPVQEASEEIADIMESTLGYQYEYAAETMPKDPGTMMSFGKSMWQPTDRELYEWGYHLTGSLFPMEAVAAIVNGAVPPQTVECLAKTNPAIFNHFVQTVMENSEAIRENATYDQKVALGLALQMPLEPTTDPQYVAFIQNTHLEKTMADIAGPTKETSSAEDGYSDAQKLLS